MRPQLALVTRQTEEHIWFILAQDTNQVEHYALRGAADVPVNLPIVVEQIEPGLWFISDPTSLVEV